MRERLWTSKKVLITGHTGFKGSWLSRWLLELGAEVSGFALEPPTTPALFDQLLLSTHLRDNRGDVRDIDRVRETVQEVQPEVVFHMAAQPLVRASYAEPIETFETNVIGTANVLQAVRDLEHPVAAIVVTTDKCYEPSPVPHRHAEGEPMGGHDPYSGSKAAAELVVESFRRSFFPVERLSVHGVALASVRAGNVIGGGDWATDRIVPDIARALNDGRPVSLRNPGSIRPWQHVLDALGGYLRLAELLSGHEAAEYAEAWNFGPADDDPASMVTVRQLAERFVDAWRAQGLGFAAEPIVDSPQRDDALPEAPHLGLSIVKAQSRLGWTPVWNTDRAIAETAGWYARVNAAGNHSDAVSDCTREQINAFASEMEQATAERNRVQA